MRSHPLLSGSLNMSLRITWNTMPPCDARGQTNEGKDPDERATVAETVKIGRAVRRAIIRQTGKRVRLTRKIE